MDQGTFEARLSELVSAISSVPSPEREKLISLAKQTRECHEHLEKSVHNMQESLDYLRVSIKYLLFDLEATRRENAYLRKLLDENH